MCVKDSFYPDIGFVDQPDLTDLALSLFADLLGKMRQESFFPVPYGLVGELKASQPEELGHIPIAELVAHAAEQCLKNDVGRDFDKVEGGAATLIVSSTTALAAKHGVARVGLPLERRDTGRLAVWAIHERSGG